MHKHILFGLITTVIILFAQGAAGELGLLDETEVIISEGEYHGAGLGVSSRRSEQYQNLVVVPPDTVTLINIADFYDDYDNGKERRIVIKMHIDDNVETHYDEEYDQVPFEVSDLPMSMNEYITQEGGNPQTLVVKTEYMLYQWENDHWDLIGWQTVSMEAYVIKVGEA